MASINVGGGGTTSYVLIIGAIIAIVVLYIFIRKNPNFLKHLGAGKIGVVADPTNPQMGETLPGPNIYTSLGDIPRSGPFGLSVANSGTSFRDNVSFPCTECARETTWFFRPGTGGGGGSTGEDVTIKMGSHGKKEDETALIGFGSIPLVTLAYFIFIRDPYFLKNLLGD